MTPRQVAVRDGLFQVDVQEAGAGEPALLYLHGESGLRWTRFHDLLAERRRVIAPSHPGFGSSSGGEQLHDLQDLVYYYLDFLDQLGLRGLALVGHGLGGMFAAELAAVQPERFSRLVLLAPFGLWLPETPTLDFFAARPAELAEAMYYDASSPAAVAAASVPTDQDALIELALERARSLSSAARYLWPIPNRGLTKRLHRVSAPTLLVWGERDGVVPPRYGEAFREGIRGARLEVIQQAAHMPQEEQPERLAALVEEFLGSREAVHSGRRPGGE